MKSLDKDEAHLWLTVNHQDKALTSNFYFQDLFHICKKLTK